MWRALGFGWLADFYWVDPTRVKEDEDEVEREIALYNNPAFIPIPQSPRSPPPSPRPYSPIKFATGPHPPDAALLASGRDSVTGSRAVFRYMPDRAIEYDALTYAQPSLFSKKARPPSTWRLEPCTDIPVPEPGVSPRDSSDNNGIGPERSYIPGDDWPRGSDEEPFEPPPLTGWRDLVGWFVPYPGARIPTSGRGNGRTHARV